MRRIAFALLVVTALVPFAGHAVDVCTWGGTAEAPTGIFTVAAPGLSNVHGAAAPLDFWASGALSGAGAHCTGTLTLSGQILPGSQCRLFYITGTATGVPGVSTFFDIGGAYSVAQFYGPNGNIVGSYGASILHDEFVDVVSACNGGGLQEAKFWATTEFTL